MCDEPARACGALQVAGLLTSAGVPAAATSGKMEQARRTEAFTGMKTFRCARKEDFKSWTVGLQQYVSLTKAYYAM